MDINRDGNGKIIVPPKECSTCKYNICGECRESSPKLTGWPVVLGDDWCGKYKQTNERRDIDTIAFVEDGSKERFIEVGSEVNFSSWFKIKTGTVVRTWANWMTRSFKYNVICDGKVYEDVIILEVIGK